jgi:hypothetical protein
MIRALLITGLLMATFSMFGTNTRITTRGDEDGCRAYLGEVNRSLHQLRTLNATGYYAMPPRMFSDGTVIKVWTVAGKDYADVYKPLASVKSPIKVSDKWYLFVSGVDNPSLTTWDLSSYSKDGEEKWNVQNSDKSLTYYSWKVDANDKGELYSIGGYYNGDYSISNSWAIKKSTLSGKEKWIVADNSGYITDVASDSTGVYVTGRKYTTNNVQVQMRSRKNGAVIWSIVHSKAGIASGYYTPHSIDVDSKYVYVAYQLLNLSTGKYQGNVITLDKESGALISTFSDAEYSAVSYKTPADIAISVQDKKKNDLSKVFILSENWLKTLDGTTIATHEYGYVPWDNNTRDVGVTSDETGVYIVCQRYSATTTKDGYDVKHYDLDGNLKWSTNYNYQASLIAGGGPFLSDIDVDDKYVYVSGYHSAYANPTTTIKYKLLQGINKETGVIEWTEIGDVSQTFWWGVSTVFIGSSSEEE